MEKSIEKLEQLLKNIDSLNNEINNQKLEAISNQIAALIVEMKLKLNGEGA